MKTATTIRHIAAAVFVTLSLLLLATGCATPYASTGLLGGFSDTQLAPDVFRVNFQGNGFTSAERTQDFALLRAAELSRQHGFSQFALLNESSSASVGAFTTPGQSYTSGSAYVHGNTATYSGHTTYYPGQTYFIEFPKSGLLFRCFNSKPEGIFTFDVDFLVQTLKKKYKIK